jgi:hypothetical protein
LRLFGAVLLLVPAGAFVIGYESVPRTSHPNPIRLEGGVPVGVLDTPAGAVAAADNYLSAEDDALVSAGDLRRVLDAAWTPAARAVEFAQPFPAAALAGKPATFPDLELTAAVAGDRLESYTAGAARIGVWHEVTIWSRAVSPAQRWTLDTVTLVWQASQWMVASHSSAPQAQTPVPAWTSGGPDDRTSEAFDTRLAGMSAPYYGGR